MTAAVSIFFHNYYGDHEKWLRLFATSSPVPFNLYYNIVEESIFNFESEADDLRSFFSQARQEASCNLIIRKSSNKGKDIGGKLLLLDAYERLDLKTRYGLFVHDKKSPYKTGNNAWAGHLLRTIEPGFAQKAISLLGSNEELGIIAPSGTLKNEYNSSTRSFEGTNAALLETQMDFYDLHPVRHHFIAGTMFWFRMDPVRTFFQKNHPLQIRATLENGNILDELSGSYTHCWERMLTWTISSMGYDIKLI